MAKGVNIDRSPITWIKILYFALKSMNKFTSEMKKKRYEYYEKEIDNINIICGVSFV